MTFTRVPDFLPSQSGFHFSNHWPLGTTYPVVTLPVVGTIAGGDAGNGLCGGFVLAALDLFCHTPRLLPPSNTDLDRPANGSPIFNYITERLIDSWGDVTQGPNANAVRVIEWIQTPGHDVTFSLGPGLARRVIEVEWPQIKIDIDSGVPSPLNLVGGPERGALDVTGTIDSLHHCHQVLAYAYEVDNANNLTLLVYDCNDPVNDNSTLSLNLSNPTHTTPIASPAISANMAGGINVRGFFRSHYDLHDPSMIAGNQLPDVPTASQWNWLNMGKPQGANISGLVGAVTVMDTPTAPQRTHLFVAGNDGNLWCRWSSGMDWYWTNMGKPQTANIRGLLGAVTVMDTLTSPQRAHVFVEGNDGNLWCRWSSSTDWNWLNMGKPQGANIRGLLGAVTVMDTPISPQRPHIFVEGNDFNLWCLWSSGTDWNWLNMSKPAGANIIGLAGVVTVMDTPASPQRAHLFVAGNDGNLWCRWSSGMDWNWLNMGKPAGANIRGLMGAVTVMDTPTSPQRPHVFVEGTDFNLWCLWYSGSQWNWSNMGKPAGANIIGLVGAVTVMDTPTAPQRPHLFLAGNDTNLWCLWYNGSQWNWSNRGKPAGANIRGLLGAVTVMDTPTSPQRPHVFVEGNDYNLWCLWWG